MVQIDIPAGFVVGMFAIDLGRKALKKDYENDQYHSLNGHAREAMASVWSNPYSFSVGWVGVMIYFDAALCYLCLNIMRENRQTEG